MLWEPGDDLLCLRTRSIKENFLEGKERRWYSQDHSICTGHIGSWGQPPGGLFPGPKSLRHVLLQSLLERAFHFIPYSPGMGLQTSYKRVFFSWYFTFEKLIQFSLTFIHQIFKVCKFYIFDSYVKSSTWNVPIYTVLFSYLTLSIYHVFIFFEGSQTSQRFVYLIYLFKVLVLDLTNQFLDFLLCD